MINTHSKKTYPIIRYSLFILCAILLSSCGTHKKQPPQNTPEIIESFVFTEPSGSPLPAQYTVNKGAVQYQIVSFNDLPDWNNQEFDRSLNAFKKGCERIKSKKIWQSICQQANNIHHDPKLAKLFFEKYFTPWKITQNNNPNGLITAYYEPVIKGDIQKTAEAKFPIYGIPTDFIEVPLPAHLRNQHTTIRIKITSPNQGIIATDGQYTAYLGQFPINAKSRSIKGRIANGRFIPYYSRADINAGALNGKAPILGYANNAVELFFLHIQGSGLLQLPNGQLISLNFANKNDLPYISIGRYMSNKGYLPLNQTSMQGIKNWLQNHPHKLAEVLGQNPSYIFFRIANRQEGPIGALGVALTPQYSAAIDRHYIELGAPIFISTRHIKLTHPINRLIMAQDTGSAINGAIRVDYFWGTGYEAGEMAGKMKNQGKVWLLLPNGSSPAHL